MPLQIRIGDSPLDLFPDETLSLDLKNPIFEGYFVQGEFAWAKTIPNTLHNAQLLQHPSIPSSTPRFDTPRPGSVQAGLLLLPASISVSSASPAQIEISITFAAGKIAQQLSDRLISALPLGPAFNPAHLRAGRYLTSLSLDAIHADYQTTKTPQVLFPTSYQDEEIFFHHNLQNGNQHSTLQPEYIVTGFGPGKYLNLPSGSAFLYPIIKAIFNSVNLTLTDQVFTHPAFAQFLKSLLIFNNNTLPIFYSGDDAIGYMADVINAQIQDFLPRHTYATTLRLVTRTFFAALYIDLFSSNASLIFNQQILDSAPVHNWTDIFEQDFTLTQDSPTGFKILYDPSIAEDDITNTYLKTFRDINITATYLDPGALPTPTTFPTFARVLSQGSIYARYSLTETWKPFCLDFQNLLFGQEYTDYPTALAPPAESCWLIPGPLSPPVPTRRQKDSDKIPTTLIAWHGQVSYTNSYGQPATAYAANASSVLTRSPTTPYPATSAPFSLRLDGPTGTVATFGTPWLNALIAGKEIKGKVLLTEESFLAFKMHHKIQIGPDTYLVKSLKPTLPIFGPTPVTLFRLP